MRASIRTVAQEAGVSIATVSNVLNGNDERTSAITRERVLQVAQRLNYLPVRPPTSQNRPTETKIVTLVPEHQDMENHELDLLTYRGIVEIARQRGYDILTMVGQTRKACAEDEKERYLDRRSDGFIFAVSNHGYWETALNLVAEHQIPTVACYRHDVPVGVAGVDVDNAGAMEQAVDHLVASGHRCIAYLSGPPDNFDEQQRCAAWKKAMENRGLEIDERQIVRGAEVGYVPNLEAIASISRLGVTAVVCFNDTLALRLWDSLEEQGLKVPHHVSLIGMDNRPEAAKRGLSSLAHSFVDVGRLAMEAWIDLKNGADSTTCCKIAPVHLIVRDSVRPLRESF